MKKRINEIPTITQWIDLVTKRRVKEEFDGVSEKEFLLCHATSIKKCKPYLTLTNDSVIELIAQWKGSGYFFNISTSRNQKSILDIN